VASSATDAAGEEPPARSTGRAIVLVPVLSRAHEVRSGAGARRHSPEDRLTETVGLAEAIGLEVVEQSLVPVPDPKPGTLFGSGKVDGIKARAEALGAGLVVIDHPVSAIQQRNLEKAWGVKVLDRTALILEIFGARARTREGRLQVELAHLEYQRSRLVRTWTHLERQRGGYGFLGGPGEAQIELDRRMISERIEQIRKELSKVVRTRELHRKGRRRVPYPVVAIVGYTNAGKSTLFNRLTGAAVLAKDQVFATLDPTMREVRLASGRRIILSDTVGFISDLPTMLVAAFRATLEEVIAADLILHVRDIAHPETDAQAEDVEGVLGDLGIDLAPAERHLLEVWNKIDLLGAIAREEAASAARFREGAPVLISATTGAGLADLLAAIDDRLGVGDEVLELVVPATAGRLVNWLHESTHVIARETADDGMLHMRVRVTADKKGQLLAQLGAAGGSLSPVAPAE
jgi:GTP-binding protein HflX